MPATVVSVQRDRAWTSASRLVRATARSERPRERRTSFFDVVVVVYFLALIGIATLGGVVMLLSWVAATVSVRPPVACPEVGGCARPEPDEHHDPPADDQRTDDPTLTR
jgi:hypothetical protein